MIRFNSIHDSSICKQAARGLDQPCESVWKGRLELNSSYLDASQGTELVLHSNWHTTASQVTCNWRSRKTWSSAKFTRPSPPTARRFATRPHDRPGGEGLAARLGPSKQARKQGSKQASKHSHSLEPRRKNRRKNSSGNIADYSWYSFKFSHVQAGIWACQ